jgi:predicted transposase YbfD/YdcC
VSKKNFQLAEKAGAILVAQVKDNQKTLHTQVKLGCAREKCLAQAEERTTKAHGRVEKRTYRAFLAKSVLGRLHDEWPEIQIVIEVISEREVINIDKEMAISRRYYVTNRAINLCELASCIREHWFVENKLHYVKDQTIREDCSVKRVNPYIFSMCIDAVLNIMRLEGVTNISEETFINCMDLDGMVEKYGKYMEYC